MDNYLAFSLGLLVNSGIALLILRYVYAPMRQDKDYVLMFLSLNTLVFMMASLLKDINISLGLGLSIFAVFRVLRFRTAPIPMREMSYLFVMLALPVLNAVLLASGAHTSLALAGAAVMATLLLVERLWNFHGVAQKLITYERVEWIRPEHAEALLADLRDRTGLDIRDCEIGRIDFLRDTVEITITYTEHRPAPAAIRPSGATTGHVGQSSTERTWSR
jgi:hypothetical protein